jgi:hypothetical protein
MGPLLALGTSALHTEEMQSTSHRALDAQGAATEMREYEVVGVQVAAVRPHLQSACDIGQLLDLLTGVSRPRYASVDHPALSRALQVCVASVHALCTADLSTESVARISADCCLSIKVVGAAGLERATR